MREPGSILKLAFYNLLYMPALTIYKYSIHAALYKHRWKVEFFFKWIKQHLKIKSFGGTTENTVKTHVYIAVITHTLVPIIWQRLKTAYTTYEVLQILGSSLLDKTLINQLLEKSSDQDVKELL